MRRYFHHADAMPHYCRYFASAPDMLRHWRCCRYVLLSLTFFIAALMPPYKRHDTLYATRYVSMPLRYYFTLFHAAC